jgi:aconitate hydratase
VDQRATICNMGAELGATTSIFPSDERTLAYLKAQGRARDWSPWSADDDADYDDLITLDLSAIEPLIAKPSMPDNVVPLSDLVGLPVAQVCIGSCVNSSYQDLAKVGRILKGKRVHPDVSLTITPGSKQVYTMIADDGTLADLIWAGARILESACGPCLGMGQAPATGVATLRSFNRNFKGRSGTADDRSYLASPEVCAAAALTGKITDPRTLGEAVSVQSPAAFAADDNMILPPLPEEQAQDVIVRRGPNIKPVPIADPLPDKITLDVLLKVGDNITTDDIMPAGAKILPLRSNIPAIAEYVFVRIDPDFAKRAKSKDGGTLIGGINYGQGSSREHAALAPMYLGVKAVLAKSYARIHQANLVNMGMLPLVFVDPGDYDGIEQGARLELSGIQAALEQGSDVQVTNRETGETYQAQMNLTGRQREILQAGGLLNLYRNREVAR